MGPPTSFVPGVAANPDAYDLEGELNRLYLKVEAGAVFVPNRGGRRALRGGGRAVLDRPASGVIVQRPTHRWRNRAMTRVTVSPKYQVVIPKEVREKLGIQPGQKVEVFAVGSRVELVPVQPIASFRGRFPDLPPFESEPDRL